MTQHFLKHIKEELLKTHELLESYKLQWFTELFYHFFWSSFKKSLFLYAHKKEEILVEYTSLYAEITKDIHESRAEKADIDYIQECIISITTNIQICNEYLSKLHYHSKKEEDIIKEEKIFFKNLIESFHNDLLQWTSSHEKSIFWSYNTSESDEKISLKQWKNMLKKQKERLEEYMQSNTY